MLNNFDYRVVNNILRRIILSVLMVGFGISCTGSVKPNPIKKSGKQAAENSNQIIKNDQRASLNIYESVVYSIVIEDIFYGSEFGNISKSNWLAYRRTTIPVENIEQIKETSQLSSELLINLQNISNTSKILDDEYDVKLSLQAVDGEESMERLFEESQRKNPKIAAVMEFSRISFNAEKNEALVYVRFYNSDLKLQERFCLVTLETNDRGIYKENLKWLGL